MSKETGGPAYPSPRWEGWGSPQEGMTLRDYFAAKATEEDVRNYINDYSEMVDGFYYSFASEKFESTKVPKKRTREQAKYIYADSMLEARK